MNARRNLFFIFLLLGIALNSTAAQQVAYPYKKEIDSLKKVLNTKQKVVDRARVLFDLSYYYSFSDSTNAHYYLDQGLALNGKAPIISGMGKFYEGMFYMDYDLPRAIELMESAESELAAINSPEAKKLRARTLNNIATAYQWQDKHVKMLDVLINRALPVAFDANDNVITGNIHYKIGMNFWNNLQYVEANRYLNDAVSYLKKGNYDHLTLNEIYKLLIISLHASNETEKADSLIADFERFSKKHKGELPLGDYYYIHGTHYRFKKQYDKALELMDKAIEATIRDKDSDPRSWGGLHYQRTLINIAKKDYKAALVDLKNNVEANIKSHTAFFQDSLNLALAYVKIYEGLGDYPKVLEWIKKKDVLQEAMYNRKIRESIVGYEVKYQTLQKENEILSLKAEREKTESDIRNTRVIIALVAIMLVLIGYFLVKNHQKNKRLLQQQEINNQQKLLDEKQKQKLMSLDAMLQGEEKERNRLSRDLHDGLGSILASIKYKVLDLQLINPHDKVNSVLMDMDYAITEMRRISHNLMPEALRRFGLEVSLNDLCKSLQNINTKIELQVYGSLENLTLDQQTHIYRIIQELIYNSLKHSGAKHILVQCSMEDNVIFITVEDDGVGFAPHILNETSKVGAGLKNVKIRVNYLHGKLDIRSEIGKGTSVDIELSV